MDTVKRAQLAAKARWAKPGAREAASKRIRAILRVSKLAKMAAKLNATTSRSAAPVILRRRRRRSRLLHSATSALSSASSTPVNDSDRDQR